MKEKKENTLADFFKQTSYGLAYERIKRAWEENKNLILLNMGLTAASAIVVTGFAYTVFSPDYSPNIISVPYAGLFKMPLVSVILTVLFSTKTFKFAAAIYRQKEIDKERNIETSKEGYYGTATKVTEDEKARNCTVGNYLEQKENILGTDIDDPYKLYALKKQRYKNGNVLITGAPGCGKSVGYILPIIMQTIRRGESLVVTDLKGELYRESAAIAKAHNYTVKYLSFDPHLSLHTDTCNFMGVIGDDLFKAQSFSKTVVDNTNDGKSSDFWTESEYNLFIGVSIFVNRNKIGIPKTMGGVYQLLYTHSVDEFEHLCFHLEETDPAMPYLKTFMNGDKTVKGNTYAGLQIRLSALADPLVQNIVGVDDIDMSLPGKEKCIYFIGSSDSDRSRSYLMALYFALQYDQLVAQAKKNDNGRLNIPVTMLLDEYPNIGVIPAFQEKLSTVRGYGIDTIMAIQGIGQLQKLHPDNEWENIINCCSIKIALCINDILSSEYFSKLSGEATSSGKGKTYNIKTGDILENHAEEGIKESHVARYVYTPHEIRHLDPDHALIFISQCNVFEVKKINYYEHPMAKEIRKWVPSYHAPKWVLGLSDKDKIKYRICDENGKMIEKYRRESIEDIVLCTDDDFLKMWTPEDQKELEIYIKNFKKKKRNLNNSEKSTGQSSVQPKKNLSTNTPIQNNSSNHPNSADENISFTFSGEKDTLANFGIK